MNSYSFCRWFKRLIGLSPHQYVIQCRIERAKFLLTYTQLPIIEIALQVGCSSQSNFTTLFRQHIGITPKAYREMI
ncbi:helix-turn-helix transcriptional regulator [Nostoc sp.]|uniref:helix-turn-helix transcriptional regulator n=1 Tax=Nostoc sp. TaxID=1180 RepID=UPI00303124FB